MAETEASIDGPGLAVSVAFSPCAGVVDEIAVRVAPGSTVADAIAASGLQQRHPGFELASLPVGVWGVRCERDQALHERDRVELYRPLKVDPKDARRLRSLADTAVADGKRRR